MEKPETISLDKFLGKPREFIALVGVELEGGWTRLPPGAALVHDGSVQVPRPSDFERYQLSLASLQADYNNGAITRASYNTRMKALGAAPLWQAGELPSEPRPPHEVPAWMRAYYPQIVNASCGLHVHMSFKSVLYYQRLMTPVFMWTLMKYVAEWAKKEGLPQIHPIWERLLGKSRYCRAQFHADMQAQQKSKDHDQSRPGHRYTVLNYCWTVHQTIECRLLPMMEGADLGIRAVQNILAITNAFLMATREKEHAKKTEIRAYNPTYADERRYMV